MQSHQLTRDDRGSVTFLVVVLMPIMVLFASLAFDGARQHSYKREAQGRADAGAVAAALACYDGGGCSPAAAASPYAGGGVTLDSASCDSTSCTVAMKEPVTYQFAPGSTTVTASATAKWTGLGSAKGVFPITFAMCGITSQPVGTLVTLYSDDVLGCGNGPGQFGLVQNGCGGSAITVDATGNFYLTVAQGNSFKSKTGCDPAGFNAALLNKPVLLPVWDSHVGNTYHVTTFAQFTLKAWSANGNSDSSPAQFAFDGVHALTTPNPKKCPAQAGHDDNSGACVQGIITGYTTEIGKPQPGLACGPNGFACLVYLDH